MDIEMIVQDFVARMKEYGVLVKPNYVFNQYGDIIEINFKIVGRCN